MTVQSFGGALRNQLVRAVMSVPTNFVEGRAQKSERDFARFLGYAVASLDEVEYHLIQSLTAQLKVNRKQIHALLKKLKQSGTSQTSRQPNAEEVLG